MSPAIISFEANGTSLLSLIIVFLCLFVSSAGILRRLSQEFMSKRQRLTPRRSNIAGLSRFVSSAAQNGRSAQFTSADTTSATPATTPQQLGSATNQRKHFGWRLIRAAQARKPAAYQSLQATPACSIQITRLLVQEVLLGKSLSFAVRSLPVELIKGSPYLYSIWEQLGSGASFEEALQIAAAQVHGVLDKFYELIFTSSRISPEELLKSLELAMRFAQFLHQHFSREKARTVQLRMQFLLISCIVPLLLVINLLLFPDLIQKSLEQFWPSVALLCGVLLYICGVCIFRRMGRESAAILEIPKKKPSGKFKLAKKFFRNELATEIHNLVFLVGLEISLKTGRTMKSALTVAAEIASQSFLAICAERVLHMQMRGNLLKEAFQQVEFEMKPFYSHKRTLSAQARAVEVFSGIGRVCHDTQLLIRFVSNCVDENKNSLKDLSEESTGALTVKLLFPLCFCHLPAALLTLLAPVFALMGGIL